MRAEPHTGRDSGFGEKCWLRLYVPPAVSDPFHDKRSTTFTGLLACMHMHDMLTNHDTVDFDTFSKILNRPGGFREPGEPEEYCRGFQVFDKDMTGFIGVGQLRYILTNLGEKMSDDEVDELLKAVDTSSGEINYTGMLLSYTYSQTGTDCDFAQISFGPSLRTKSHTSPKGRLGL
jgi:hypothetical protein